jgi:hypothetical protein
MTTPADVPVYCCACGTGFPSPEHEPGDLKPHLVNGLCSECRRLMRRPNHQTLAENDRLKAEVARLQAVATEYGACTCLWDVDEEADEGDVIVKPNPACVVHGSAR